MKKLLLFVLLSAGLSVTAQTDTERNFQNKISQLEKAKTAAEMSAVISFFENPASDSAHWHPAYYAAYANLKQAQLYIRSNNVISATDNLTKAEQHLQKISSQAAGNSEIRALIAYKNILKISANPGADNSALIKEAKELLYLNKNVDPANPRLQLLRAQLNYVMLPTGAGKDLSSQFQSAADALRSFKPKTAGDPTWGIAEAQYYLSVTNKKTK